MSNQGPVARPTSGKPPAYEVDVSILTAVGLVGFTLRGHNTAMFPLTPKDARRIGRALVDAADKIERDKREVLKAAEVAARPKKR